MLGRAIRGAAGSLPPDHHCHQQGHTAWPQALPPTWAPRLGLRATPGASLSSSLLVQEKEDSLRTELGGHGLSLEEATPDVAGPGLRRPCSRALSWQRPNSSQKTETHLCPGERPLRSPAAHGDPWETPHVLSRRPASGIGASGGPRPQALVGSEATINPGLGTRDRACFMLERWELGAGHSGTLRLPRDPACLSHIPATGPYALGSPWPRVWPQGPAAAGTDRLSCGRPCWGLGPLCSLPSTEIRRPPRRWRMGRCLCHVPRAWGWNNTDVSQADK